MITKSPYLEAPRRLRAFVRAHETSLVILAALVGVIGGLVVAVMSAAVNGLHVLLFNINPGDRLSSQVSIDPLRALLVPSLGGLLLGIAFLLLLRIRPAREVDPIEATALHGRFRSIRCAPCWFQASGGCCSGLLFCCCCALGLRARSTRSRPMPCMADGCRSVAA